MQTSSDTRAAAAAGAAAAAQRDLCSLCRRLPNSAQIEGDIEKLKQTDALAAAVDRFGKARAAGRPTLMVPEGTLNAVRCVALKRRPPSSPPWCCPRPPLPSPACCNNLPHMFPHILKPLERERDAYMTAVLRRLAAPRAPWWRSWVPATCGASGWGVERGECCCCCRSFGRPPCLSGAWKHKRHGTSPEQALGCSFQPAVRWLPYPAHVPKRCLTPPPPSPPPCPPALASRVPASECWCEEINLEELKRWPAGSKQALTD